MGQGGIFKELSKALIERCLKAELDTHLEEKKLELERQLKENLVNQKFKFREGDVGDSKWRV